MISGALAILETDKQRSELSEFYKENKTRLYRFAFSRLHNRESAEDALQEAFLNIVKYPKTFFALDAHKKVSYTLLIISNTISRMMKDRYNSVEEELIDEIEDDSLSVEDIVIGNISADQIKDLINELPEARRQALKLKIVYDLSYRQIADILGITEVTVRKRISDACKILKNYIEENGS